MTLCLSATKPVRSATMLLLAIASLFATGCKTPVAQTLLERENFQQEKTIEELKDQVDDAEHDLEQCRRENAALKRKLGGDTTVRSPSDSPTLLAPPEASAPSSRSNTDVPLFQPPSVDHGTPSVDSSTPPTDSPAPSSSSQPQQWTPPKTPSRKPAAPLPEPEATTSSYEQEEAAGATRIAIVRLLTNGHQFGHGADRYSNNSALGDNGIEVVFSPRDAENKTVATEGTVAIVVIDPAVAGLEARVARWDFSAREAKPHYRETLFGKAYRFDLLWPHDAPQHEKLKLFVRLTTPDGQRLEANQTIHVRLGMLAPPPDNSNLADSPAPAGETSIAGVLPTRPVSSTTTSSTTSPTTNSTTARDMGEFEPDEPAPTATRSPPVTRNGAVWKPFR